MRQLPASTDPSILSGFHSGEDVGVVRLEGGAVLVQSVDFFTPVVDDPYTYGAIAAANALSDLYTAGAHPLTALSVLCYPDGDDLDVLAQILRGGYDKVREAGAHLVGGHSVSDDEIKFGLAVTGIAAEEEVLLPGGAQPGDHLVLTKPLGTGILSTAIKSGQATDSIIDVGHRQMARLNADACRAMLKAGAHGATDITGFGLVGHAMEMARASGVTFRLESDRLPLIPGILPYAGKKKFLTRGSQTNRAYARDAFQQVGEVAPELAELVFDPQTSGGLLVSLPPNAVGAMQEALSGSETEAVRVGEVLPHREGEPSVLLQGS